MYCKIHTLFFVLVTLGSCSLGSYIFSSNSIAFIKQRHCVYISVALLFDRKSNEFFYLFTCISRLTIKYFISIIFFIHLRTYFKF